MSRSIQPSGLTSPTVGTLRCTATDIARSGYPPEVTYTYPDRHLHYKTMIGRAVTHLGLAVLVCAPRPEPIHSARSASRNWPPTSGTTRPPHLSDPPPPRPTQTDIQTDGPAPATCSVDNDAAPSTRPGSVRVRGVRHVDRMRGERTCLARGGNWRVTH